MIRGKIIPRKLIDKNRNDLCKCGHEKRFHTDFGCFKEKTKITLCSCERFDEFKKRESHIRLKSISE